MDHTGYTSIPDWMLSYDLDIYETIILAVIYGFSQDGESTFKGSIRYLSEKAKCSRRKVTMVLPKLVAMGLVTKIDKDIRGVHLCEYKVSPMCIGYAPYAQGGSASDAHNNIDIENIDINTLSNKETRQKFAKPSVEEIRQYCQEKGVNVDAEQFFNFYESKGWLIGKSPMKNWKAAVSTWAKRMIKSPITSGTTPRRKESVLEHNLKVMDQMFGTNYHEQTYGKKEVCDEQ